MKRTNQAELLAPAGSADAAWAAFHYGADAVFAGLPRFSARAEATNLSAEQLDELIGYAHAHGRKVYITLNTLVQQHELPDALEALALIHDLKADGVIVQDMGVARMARRFFPSLELHASTQLAVHNTAGAQRLAEIGFSRVVLARELSLPEINTITKNCGIETEVFIHGALCYSYSGLCLFSSHLNSRSGNRGKCAYCCRQNFQTEEGQSLPFSMKDFAVGEYFDALLQTGVASLKIEGRMKSPTYVAAVTDFYRKRMKHGLDNNEQQQLLSDIQTIFGRPATSLYLGKKTGTDLNHEEHKDHEAHPAQNPTSCPSSLRDKKTPPKAGPIGSTTNGHRGAVIGTILDVFKDRGQHWIRLHTNRSLMKHDGLKIERDAVNEPFNFPALEIRFAADRKKHLRFEVPADSEIEVQLPTDRPFIESGSTIYCSTSQEVRQRYGFEAPRPGVYRQRKPFNASVKLTPKGLELTATANGLEIDLTVKEPLSEARQPEKTVAAIRKSFEKTGDTEWQLAELHTEDNGRFAPASILNEARRTLLEQLSEKLNTKKQHDHVARLEALVLPPIEPGADERWSVKLRDLSLLNELTTEERARIHEIVLDHPDASTDPSIRIGIPVIQRKTQTSDYRDPNAKLEIANIGALPASRESIDLVADWPLYTLNTEAAEQWRELGIRQNVLSPEDTADNLKALLSLLGDRAILPIYQHTPLMISATRPEGETTLTDRQQRTLHIEQYNNLYTLIFEEPFSLIEHLDELREAGARHFRIDLTYGIHAAHHAAEVIRAALNGTPIPGSYDGNYHRTL